MTRIRIATRRSQLAMWQADHVAGLLRTRYPDLQVSLLPLTTSGDRLLGSPLQEAGGKGLFVKELERALLDGEADIAVHSMKDVPAEQPAGLTIGCLLRAEDARDAWVSSRYPSLQKLPAAAVVGTASLRRQAQLLALRPDVRVELLRGNLQTRLRRLDEGDFDAILLACAGLRRLRLQARIRRALPLSEMLPAPGQGIIGIEQRDGDAEIRRLLQPLACPISQQRMLAERGFSAALAGDCRLPLAAHAEVDGDRLRLEGLVATPDGRRVLRDGIDGDASQAAMLGVLLADRMCSAGAEAILEISRQPHPPVNGDPAG